MRTFELLKLSAQELFYACLFCTAIQSMYLIFDVTSLIN